VLDLTRGRIERSAERSAEMRLFPAACCGRASQRRAFSCMASAAPLPSYGQRATLSSCRETTPRIETLAPRARPRAAVTVLSQSRKLACRVLRARTVHAGIRDALRPATWHATRR
jgi:hypothetical protein